MLHHNPYPVSLPPFVSKLTPHWNTTNDQHRATAVSVVAAVETRGKVTAHRVQPHHPFVLTTIAMSQSTCNTRAPWSYHSSVIQYTCTMELPQLCHTIHVHHRATAALTYNTRAPWSYHSSVIQYTCTKKLPQLCHTIHMHHRGTAALSYNTRAPSRYRSSVIQYTCTIEVPQLCHVGNVHLTPLFS